LDVAEARLKREQGQRLEQSSPGWNGGLADFGVVSAQHHMLASILPEGVPIFSMMMSSKPVY
jgi:hypothetical protein